MRVLRIEVPDRLAEETDALVKAGWFTSESELARLALMEFIRRYRLELLERFQRDDIVSALRQNDG